MIPFFKLLIMLLASSWASFASSSHLVVTTSARSQSASTSLAGHSSKLYAPPSSSSQLLKLRGGGIRDALVVTLPPAFIHTVVISLLANSIAILTCNEFLISKTCGLPHWRVYVHNLLITFAIYMVIFFFTGFVPMGYVPGAKPFAKFFEP